MLKKTKQTKLWTISSTKLGTRNPRELRTGMSVAQTPRAVCPEQHNNYVVGALRSERGIPTYTTSHGNQILLQNNHNQNEITLWRQGLKDLGTA